MYLTREPLAMAVVPGGGGAVVTFLGVVRPDRLEGRTVRALDYDAYVEMAERQFEQWIDEARRTWGLTAVEVRHRMGRVHVGEVSVSLVVSAPHRAQAYAASQFLIERIKRDAPIWKQEQYEDGTSQWVTCDHEALDVADPNHADV